MPGTSKKTVVVGVRLPIDVAKKVRLMAERRDLTTSQYVAGVVIAQVARKR